MYKKYYTYRLSRDSDNAEIIINPALGGDAKIISKKAPDQIFKRKELSNDITLTGSDFDFVYSQDIETEFTFTAFYRGRLRFTGTFYKTDCTFIIDESSLTVKPEVKDQYTKVLARLDDEFSLSDLTPAQTPVTADRPGIIQIYDPEVRILSNHQDNLFWETEISSEPTLDQLTSFHFATIPAYLIDRPLQVSGLYIKDTNPVQGYPQQGTDFTLTHTVEPYRIVQVESFNTTKYHLINYETNEILYRTDSVQTGLDPEEAVTTETYVNETSNNIEFDLLSRPLYSRLITNSETVLNAPTSALPSDDIYPVNTYQRSLPIKVVNLIANTQTSVEPDEYGFVTNNDCQYIFETKYYNAPEAGTANANEFYPVAESAWSCASFWFFYNDSLRSFFDDALTVDNVNRAYTLNSVLVSLLAEIDDTITHEPDTLHSQFLYGENPIDQTNLTAFIVPVRAVYTNTERPVLPNSIKLSEVLDMIYNTWKCKWYVDSDNRFRIEQIKYFELGGDYVSQQLQISISQFREPQTNKHWGFGQRVLSYNKQELPRQIVRKWHAQQRTVFDGYPIDVVSRFVKEDLRKEITISPFLTDYNFFIATESVTDDVFFLLSAENLDTGYKVAYKEITLNSETYNLQNGYVSNPYLDQAFHRYGLPAQNVKINGIETTALSVMKSMQQKINMAFDFDNDGLKLIETRTGIGDLVEISEGLETGEKNLTIEYVAN